MEDLMKKKLGESKNKIIQIILFNNFKYAGKILNYDDKWLELLDTKTSKIILFNIKDLKSLEVLG